MRRLVFILGAVFVFEAALYSALTPLLASYAEHGGISRLSAGILNGAYALGLIPGSIAAVRIARRAGVRTTTLFGVVLFACATGAFAIASDIAELDISRAAQGIAAGCMWGGALAWLMNIAPKHRQGEFAGLAAGASTLGTVAGPAVGILAFEFGRESAYIGCGLAILILTIPLRLLPTNVARAESPTSNTMAALKTSGTLRLGVWLNLLTSACFAILITLLPLRLEHAGATPSNVGLTFLIGAGLSALVARPAGRLSDRVGSHHTSRGGLIAGAAILSLFSIDLRLMPLAILTVCATVILAAGIAVPAGRLFFVAALEGRFSAATSASAMLLSIAVGESVGAPLGSLAATAAGEAAPFLAIAALFALASLRVGETAR